MNKTSRELPLILEDASSDVRSRRIAWLLSEIWREGHVSRSRLSKITGLALPSVTRLVQELKTSGLILETEKGESSGGRQPLLIQLNPDAGRVISLDLSGVELRAAILDATSQTLRLVSQPFLERKPESLQQQMLSLCQELLLDPLARPGRVLGFGVSVPGTVDRQLGIICDALNLHLFNFPIRDIIQEAFGLPVYLEHDTSAAALAEMSLGAGQGVTDLIYITVSSGIGAGLVINHQIHRGESSLAGELGHVVVERGGQICICGKNGCLEAVAAVPAMLANLQSVLLRQADPARSSWLPDTLSESGGVTLNTLMAAASAGDYFAQEIINRAADYLAMAVSMMASILDIRLVVIGGDVVHMGEQYFSPLRSALLKYQPEGPNIRAIPSQLGENASLKGAGMVALQNCLVR